MAWAPARRHNRGVKRVVFAVIIGCYTGRGEVTPLPLPDPGSLVVDFDVNSLDATPDQEEYMCFVAELGVLADKPLSAVKWIIPTGPIVIHHISLYATTTDLPIGRVSCDKLEGPRFAIYTPGSANIDLRSDLALELPTATRRVAVEVHAQRRGPGIDTPGRVSLVASADRPHVAGWIETGAYIAPMPPRASEVTLGRCWFDTPLHVEFVWAHMHKSGRGYHSSLVRANGDRMVLVDIPKWDVSHQPLYSFQFEAQPGDRIDFECEYLNETADTITSGPYSTNEMCGLGLIAWPREAAHCTP